MAADSIRTQNGLLMFIPPNGANIIPPGQGIPIMQPSGAVQYIGQQSDSSQFQQNRRLGILEKFLKSEAKTLGAIQIIIGLALIGFGSVSALLVGSLYYPLASVSGYPFWGGIFFIASGSLVVSTKKNLNRCLAECSVGMNVTSAVIASVGIILYIANLALNQSVPPYPSFDSDFRMRLVMSVENGLSVLLLLFSFLELCITILTAHFGCQTVCCNNEMAMTFVPYTIIGDSSTPYENRPAPPAYENIAHTSSAEA